MIIFAEAGRGLGLNITTVRLPDGKQGIFVQKIHPNSVAAHTQSIRSGEHVLPIIPLDSIRASPLILVV